MDKAMHSEIPQWVIDYNNAGHQSSAGKAVGILMKENQSLRAELQKQKELNAELVKGIADLKDSKLSEKYIDQLTRKYGY